MSCVVKHCCHEQSKIRPPSYPCGTPVLSVSVSSSVSSIHIWQLSRPMIHGQVKTLNIFVNYLACYQENSVCDNFTSSTTKS